MFREGRQVFQVGQAMARPPRAPP